MYTVLPTTVPLSYGNRAMGRAFEITVVDGNVSTSGSFQLTNESMSPLFAATAEATEEVIYNANFKAATVTSARGSLQAIPIEDLQLILEKHQVLGWDKSLRP